MTFSKLENLRNSMRNAHLDAFLVPMADRFQNEYLPEDQRRIAWLTGFSGSAGYVIITVDQAVLFVDSRYTEQSHQQVDLKEIHINPLRSGAITSWLCSELDMNARIGFDPWLHSINEIKHLKKVGAKKNLNFMSLAQNPIDQMWIDQPKPNGKPAYMLDLSESGVPTFEKIGQLISVLIKRGVDCPALTCDVTASNWLLNMRGYDSPYTPVFFNYTLITETEAVEVFTNLEQVPERIRCTLKEKVIFCDWSEFEASLKKHKKLYLPSEHVPEAIREKCEKNDVFYTLGDDFYSARKAQKNKVEIERMRECHMIDGLAVTRFLYFLQTLTSFDDITELSAAKTLEDFRKKSRQYLSPSFSTISALGEHAALPHYMPSEKTNASLRKDIVYLFDSGGQYTKGTTDITRTIFLGDNPSPLLKKHYTLVLKGHIALARAHFPEGTSGVQLDVLARQFLWKEGLDYGHGTGHGVGYRLNVHEGPQSISPRAQNQPPLVEGVVLSNEPGYYQKGAYGIRLENLMVVEKSLVNQEFLCFDTLSLAPFDRILIDEAILTQDEKEWVNAYHQQVFKTHRDFLSGAEKGWLQHITAPIL